jgi:hypothetical protein
MSLKEAVVDQLNNFDDVQLQKVADYLAFLRYQSLSWSPPMQEETALAALYAEFADEDRAISEEGLAEYAQALAAEDAR